MLKIQKLISDYYWCDISGGFSDEVSVNAYAHDLFRSSPNDKFRVIDSNNNVRLILG